MRTSAYFLLLLFLFTACTHKKGLPADVFPPEKMKTILWDMMRADQYVLAYVSNANPGINRSAESLKLYQKIFALHEVNETSFERSFTYYKEHPVLLKAILDSIAVMPGANQVQTPTPTIRPDRAFDTNKSIPPPAVVKIDTSPARLKAIRDSLRLFQKKQKLQLRQHPGGLQ